jgi:hypothetical protein
MSVTPPGALDQFIISAVVTYGEVFAWLAGALMLIGFGLVLMDLIRGLIERG